MHRTALHRAELVGGKAEAGEGGRAQPPGEKGRREAECRGRWGQERATRPPGAPRSADTCSASTCYVLRGPAHDRVARPSSPLPALADAFRPRPFSTRQPAARFHTRALPRAHFSHHFHLSQPDPGPPPHTVIFPEAWGGPRPSAGGLLSRDPGCDAVRRKERACVSAPGCEKNGGAPARMGGRIGWWDSSWSVTSFGRKECEEARLVGVCPAALAGKSRRLHLPERVSPTALLGAVAGRVRRRYPQWWTASLTHGV